MYINTYASMPVGSCVRVKGLLLVLVLLDVVLNLESVVRVVDVSKPLPALCSASWESGAWCVRLKREDESCDRGQNGQMEEVYRSAREVCWRQSCPEGPRVLLLMAKCVCVYVCVCVCVCV